MTHTAVGLGALAGFNSLFEMLGLSRYVNSTVAVWRFNSLFEMLKNAVVYIGAASAAFQFSI